MPTHRILAAVLLLSLFACTAHEPPKPRPNLLFVSIDTLRADHLGCYGYHRPTSPNIDALAARSVLFEHAESASSWTLPSLTALMTGLSVTGHNCDHLGSRLDPSYTTLAELLRDAGYDTQIVASHLFLGAPYGLQQGFTHVDTSVVQEENDITSPDVTRLGLEWLRNKSAVHDGVPWMLWLHYFDPHAPYLAHEGVSGRFGVESDLDRYDGEIAYTDRYVGELLDELARSPQAQNTIVVLVADHGEEFGEHGNFGHGYALHEECVHVPLVLHVPGIAPRRVSDLVPTIDLLPTLLELCRVPLRHEIEGQPMTPLLWGEPLPAQLAISEVRWMAGQDLRCVRVDRWKYIEGATSAGPLVQLFDLDTDPAENCDVHAAQAERSAALHERLEGRLRDARRIAGEHHQIGESQASPSEMRAMENTGYAGEGSGGVPKKKNEEPQPAQPKEPPK
ncbi:MAG: sulfatase [Planctomycetes bacterium]|nr:sulfatase [Planctomycetota bacterium]